MDIIGSGHLLQWANALLDSGAQINLIRSSVAERPQTKRKGHSDNNHKGGRPRRTQNEELSVRIGSLEDRSAHVIEAIEDITDVKVADIARQLGLGKS